MTIDSHNKIIKSLAKEILNPHGIFPKGQSRIWIDDNGWFLTIIEFQPSSWAKGSYLNVSMHFLWNRREYITYDFALNNSSRVFLDNGRQFVEYENDVQFTEQARRLVQLALDKAMYYRRFRDLSFAKQQIFHKNHAKKTEDIQTKMMLYFLANDPKAMDYFTEFSELEFSDSSCKNEELLQFDKRKKDEIETYDNDIKRIRDSIIEIILEQRDFWRTKGMKKLSSGINICNE